MYLKETKKALKYLIMSCLYQEFSSKLVQSRLKLVEIEILNSRLYLTEFPALCTVFDRSHLIQAYNFTSKRKEEIL